MNWRLLAVLSLILFSTNSHALYCGEWIDGEVSLTEDLDCTGHAGYALVAKNTTATINGNGFSIIVPDAIAGIYAEGSSLSLNNVAIVGSESNIGIQAYNNYFLETNNVIANDFKLGIDSVFDSYGDVGLCQGLNLQNSSFEGSVEFGVRVTAPNCLGNVIFEGVSLENSQNYGATVNVDKFILDGLNGSSVHNSYGGFLVYAREVELRNIDFSAQDVENETMLIIGSQKVTVQNSDFSGPEGSGGIGMHICEVDEVYIDNIVSNGHDVGVKISTGSKQTTVTLNNSEFVENATAGLLLSELAGVPFANVYADANSIGGNGSADILVTADILDEVITNTVDPTINLDRVVCEVEISKKIDKKLLSLDNLFDHSRGKSCKKKFSRFASKVFNHFKKKSKYSKYSKYRKVKHHYVRKLASKIKSYKSHNKTEIFDETMTLSLPSAFLEAYYAAAESGKLQTDQELQYGLTAAFLNETAQTLNSFVEKDLIEEYDEKYDEFLIDLNELDSSELISLVDDNFADAREFFTKGGESHPNNSQGCKNGKGHRKKYGRGHHYHGRGFGFGHCHDSEEKPAIKILNCQIVE